MMHHHTLTLFVAITLSGLASSSESILVGTNGDGLTQLSQGNECKTFYIKKGDNNWEVVSDTAADLKNDNVERVRGCLAYAKQKDSTTAAGQNVLNAVVLELVVDDYCTTYTACNPNLRTSYGCTEAQTQNFYHYTASRAKGYFYCNSNFSNKSLLGYLNHDRPVDYKSFRSAIQSPSIISAVEGLVTEQFEKVRNSVVNFNPDKCGDCKSNLQSVKVLFEHFYSYATPDLLENGATSYSIKTAEKQLPDWMAKRLSAESAARAIELTNSFWRKVYDMEVKTITSENPSKYAMQDFVRKFSKQKPTKLSEVDFDDWVPKLTPKIQAIEKREEAETRRKAEIADTKSRRDFEERQRAQAKRYDAWRSTLTMGADTFCGPVIEIRKPMYKIAVRAQLQGFSNEAWLKQSELFPPEYGCQNSNGRLLPIGN